MPAPSWVTDGSVGQGQSLPSLHAMALTGGWVYKDLGIAGGRYINPKTGASQTNVPLPAGYTDTPGGIRYKKATGPVTSTGASGPASGSGGPGPSETIVSASSGGDGLTEAQLQRRRRGRVQTNMTGGAAGAANVSKKTLMGF